MDQESEPNRAGKARKKGKNTQGPDRIPRDNFVAGGRDWGPERKALLDAGDEEGIKWLDDLLPSIHDEPIVIGTSKRDGVDETVRIRVLCATDVLNKLRDRQNARTLLAELAPALALGVDSAAGIGARWQALANHLYRFEHRVAGQQAVNFGGLDGALSRAHIPGSPSVPPPEQQWAEAFRDTTRALLPHARDTMPVHTLLRDLEDVLAGQAVSLTQSVRDVDLLVREILDRNVSAEAAAHRLTEEEKKNREDVLLRQHADATAGRAILEHLLSGGEADTAKLKSIAIAALMEKAGPADEDSVGAYGRSVEETLRVLRDRCLKPAGCGPCAEHLALVTSPKRGWYVLTEKGRVVAEAHRERTR